jgi:hypothetical protein
MHFLQREARQERPPYHAVKHFEALSNADTVARAAPGPAPAGRHAPSRVVFRRRHSRVHAPALLPFSHSTQANRYVSGVTRAPLPGHPPEPRWQEEA